MIEEQRLTNKFVRQNSKMIMVKGDDIDLQETTMLLDTNTDKEAIEDPIYLFGLGIVNYMRLNRILIRFLLFMSVIAMIQMYLMNKDISMDSKKILKEESLGWVEKLTS